MKRILLFILTFIFVFTTSGYVKAQFTDPTKTNLGDLLIRFCNDVGTGQDGKKATKSLQLTTEAEQEKDICIYVQNSGPTGTTVKLNFVDGTITADNSQKKACQPEETQENFGQYVIFGENEKVFDVPAGSRVEKHAQIKFPAGYAGMSYGCATLQIEGESITKTDGMFDILSRRGNFIDVLVHGEIIPKLEVVQQTNLTFPNLGNNNKLTVYKDPANGSYIAKVVLKNPGNVTQVINIEPLVTSWFGKKLSGKLQEKKEIVNDEIVTTPVLTWEENNTGKTTERKILPNNEISILFPLDGAIPFRQGNVTIDMNIIATPLVDFETDTKLEPLNIKLNTNFFLIPRNIIITVLIVLLILRLIIIFKKEDEKNKHKKKKTSNK